jgi:hypothetical protein
MEVGQVPPGLPCMNCGKELHPSEAKIFAKVLVCPLCYSVAETLFRKGERELKKLLLMLQETLRVALVEGRLHLKPEDLEDPTAQQVVTAIAQLEEKRCSHHTKTPSPESLK